MKIFVRTQDKKQLIEINSVSYKQKNRTIKNVYNGTITNEEIEIRHLVVYGNQTLGEYISEERCLNVISEIHAAVANHSSNMNLVYDMPAE